MTHLDGLLGMGQEAKFVGGSLQWKCKKTLALGDPINSGNTYIKWEEKQILAAGCDVKEEVANISHTYFGTERHIA